MNREEILVVVLSRNYSTGLSVIRSLGTQGYTVDLVASAPREGASEFIQKSKFIRKSVEVTAKKVKDEDDLALVEALKAYEGEHPTKPVLIAADDYTAAIMDNHRDVLKDIFIMPGIVGGEPGSLVHMMDKSVQGEIARSVGIKTPEEWVVSLRDEEFSLPEGIIYPCYVKPLGSIIGHKQEMERCDDRIELVEHLKKLRENYPNRSVLVQKFMYIDEEYDLEGVCMDQEIILPGIIWKQVVANYDRGVPLYGKLFPTEKFGAFMDKVREFLREFHYFGMFDLGFNVIGDEFYFNELNLRSGGTNYVYFESGVNLSEIFVKAALKEPISEEERCAKEFGKTYIYEKVAWDDYFHDNLTRKEVNEMIENADIHIMVNDYDPIPGELFNEEIAEEIRQKRNKEIRENCIALCMEDTGWERADTREKLRNIRQLLGIGYKDIAAYKAWRFDPENLEEEYKKAVERQERIRKNREDCIAKTMESTGWDMDRAKAEIKDARERLGVSYKDYASFELWKYPAEEQEEVYQKALRRRERIAQQKEQCITYAMDIMGWDREHAAEQIKDARKRLGISYKDYYKYKFCLIPVDEQQAEYDKILSEKEKDK